MGGQTVTEVVLSGVARPYLFHQLGAVNELEWWGVYSLVIESSQLVP